MTTATSSKSKLPEPDTKPDAENPADVKADKTVETESNGRWSVGTSVGVLVGVCTILGFFGALWTQTADSKAAAQKNEYELRQTAMKVERLEPIAQKVSTIEVKMGYVEQSQQRIEGKLDKVLEARK